MFCRSCHRQWQQPVVLGQPNISFDDPHQCLPGLSVRLSCSTVIFPSHFKLVRTSSVSSVLSVRPQNLTPTSTLPVLAAAFSVLTLRLCLVHTLDSVVASNIL